MADLRTLQPALVPWAKWLYAVGKYYDGRLVVTSAFRSPAKQQELYCRWLSGRSPFPAAPPGKSLHNYGLAFDLARLGVDPKTDPLLVYLASVWRSVGGSVGGSKDPVHFSVPVRG